MRTVYKVEVVEDNVIDVCLLDNNSDIDVSVDVAVSALPPSDYEGPYTVIPVAFSDIPLQTRGKTLNNNITVKEIPYYETSNVSGLTIYIG